MRLTFRLSQDDLHRADDPHRVFGGEHEALAARRARGRAAPERFRFGPRHGEHEADGGPALHAIDQHVAQPLDLAIADGLETSNLNGARHSLISSMHVSAQAQRADGCLALSHLRSTVARTF